MYYILTIFILLGVSAAVYALMGRFRNKTVTNAQE